jgi:uncharacterized membrane protein (UPF0127 family)
MKPGFLAPLLQRPLPPLVLRHAASGAIVADKLEGAFDSTSRRKGLLGRDGLPAGTALIIAPSNAVHTFSMRFPIDVVFVRRTGQVVKIRAAMPRARIAAALTAFAVIELPAGAAGAVGLGRGDFLEIVTAVGPEPY